MPQAMVITNPKIKNAADPALDFSKNGLLGMLFPINAAAVSEITKIKKPQIAISGLKREKLMQVARPTKLAPQSFFPSSS